MLSPVFLSNCLGRKIPWRAGGENQETKGSRWARNLESQSPTTQTGFQTLHLWQRYMMPDFSRKLTFALATALTPTAVLQCDTEPCPKKVIHFLRYGKGEQQFFMERAGQSTCICLMQVAVLKEEHPTGHVNATDVSRKPVSPQLAWPSLW